MIAIVAACAAAPAEPPETTVSEPNHFESLDKRVPKETFKKDLEWIVAHPDGMVEVLSAKLAQASTAERAAIALGQIGSPTAVPALAQALLKPATTTAGWQAAVALANTPGNDAERTLVDAASSPTTTVASNAVDALSMRKPPPCEAIRAALDRPEATLRFHALRSGAEAGCVDASLLARLTEDPDSEVATLAKRLAAEGVHPR